MTCRELEKLPESVSLSVESSECKCQVGHFRPEHSNPHQRGFSAPSYFPHPHVDPRLCRSPGFRNAGTRQIHPSAGIGSREWALSLMHRRQIHPGDPRILFRIYGDLIPCAQQRSGCNELHRLFRRNLSSSPVPVGKNLR